MFATLLGSLPRPPLPDGALPSELLAAAVRAQEAAGLEPVCDAGFGIGATAAERWAVTAALTDRPVKAVLPGPYSGARSEAEARRAAEALRLDLLALIGAGCPIIEIHEPGATRIGTDEAERARFRTTHQRLLDGVTGVHLSLAITGGNADAAGIATLLAAPYASLALDLIAGPDNWRLVVATPGDRGVICGALSAGRDADDRRELLLWAAGYAASTGGRGPSRVGLATASSLAELPWEVAERKLALLGEAAGLADLPPAERRVRLDPRAVDIRSAALGRVTPRPRIARRDRPPGQA
jgi:methionine synthase II (cobalamin-independent)